MSALNKRVMVILLTVVFTLVAAGAFGQNFRVGLDVGSFFDDMDNLQAQTEEHMFDNLFYGVNIESFWGNRIGYGLSGKLNFSNLEDFQGGPEKWRYYESVKVLIVDGDEPRDKNLSRWDINARMSIHLLGKGKIIDPLLEGGIGYYSERLDYRSAEYESEEGLSWGSLYAHAGAGLGINIGPVGFYARLLYNIPLLERFDAGSSNKPYVISVLGQEAFDKLGEDIMRPLSLVISAKLTVN